VRRLEPWLQRRLEEELLDLPIVVDVRGAGFFWGFELAGGSPEARFDADQREQLLRAFLPKRLREAGLIRRPGGPGDAVLQIAPPLISTAEQLDEMARGLRAVLADAGSFMGLD